MGSAIALLMVLLGVFLYLRLVVGPGIQELSISESIKGDWKDIQKFVEARGQYPNNSDELDEFYSYTPNGDEATYIKPIDDDKDEVILWWKELSRSGKKIGIRESGVIVKEENR